MAKAKTGLNLELDRVKEIKESVMEDFKILLDGNDYLLVINSINLLCQSLILYLSTRDGGNDQLFKKVMSLLNQKKSSEIDLMVLVGSMITSLSVERMKLLLELRDSQSVSEDNVRPFNPYAKL